MKKMILGVKQKEYKEDDKLVNGKEFERLREIQMQDFLTDILNKEGEFDTEEDAFLDIENGDNAEVFKNVPEEEV